MIMNKKYYIVIGILSILLVIIISLISVENLKSKNIPNENNQDKQVEQQEEQEKTYTGNIKCEMLDKNDEIYETYFIENIEVENNKVKTSEIKHKIIYKNAENYKGFKENEKVLNPIYDDENLIVEYVLKEKEEIVDREMDEYINDLKKAGYKCEKVTN